MHPQGGPTGRGKRAGWRVKPAGETYILRPPGPGLGLSEVRNSVIIAPDSDRKTVLFSLSCFHPPAGLPSWRYSSCLTPRPQKTEDRFRIGG